MFDLKGCNALITGATGGIGLAIVKKLHDAGASIIASATNQANLDKLKSAYNKRLEVVQCNLSEQLAVAELFDKAETVIGDIDILICNAGLCRDSLAVRISDEDWDMVINVNLSTVFRLNRAAIKKMMKRHYGRIINMSSIVALTGNFGQANYTATKAGLIGMSKSLAAETATHDITVNCIAPGFIESPMTENLNQKVKETIIKKIPMAKMGTPDDVANGVLFLALRESAYITGQTLHINGGMLMV